MAGLRCAFIALAPSRTASHVRNLLLPVSVSRGVYRMSGSGKHLCAVDQRGQIRRGTGGSDVLPWPRTMMGATEAVDCKDVRRLRAMACSESRRAFRGKVIDHHGSRSVLWLQPIRSLAIT